MAKRRQIGGLKFYCPWKEWVEGEFIDGILKKVDEDNYGKPNYHVEVMEIGFSEPLEYNGNTLEIGNILVLNSCGSLDYKMEEIEIGQRFRAAHNGQFQIKKGKFKGKDAHDIVVEAYDFEGPGKKAVEEDNSLEDFKGRNL